MLLLLTGDHNALEVFIHVVVCLHSTVDGADRTPLTGLKVVQLSGCDTVCGVSCLINCH